MSVRIIIAAVAVSACVFAAGAAEAKTMILTCYVEKVIEIKGREGSMITDGRARLVAFKYDASIASEVPADGNQDKAKLATIEIHDPTVLLEKRPLRLFRVSKKSKAFFIAAGEPNGRKVLLTILPPTDGSKRHPAVLDYIDEATIKASKTDPIGTLMANTLQGGCALNENDPQNLTFNGVAMLPPIVERP